MNKKFTILYVDDEVSNLNVFKNSFRRDYNIITADTAKLGLEILDREKVDLILSDQRMPEMNGVDFLKKVMQKKPEPSRILITAYTDFSALKDAVNDAKVFQYIQKPWEEKDLKQIIDNALEFYNLRQKNIQLVEELKIKNIELDKLNKELIELDEIKHQFLQIIAHEIRTPLNGIIGTTSLFSDIFEREEYQKYKYLFYMLETSIQRFSEFMLIAQRITTLKTQKYKIYPEVANVNTILKRLMNGVEEKLLEKDLHFEVSLCNDDKSNCLIEKELIEICISIILDNAIKYSQNNGIISVNTRFKENMFLIEIIDNGPGFSERVLKNIFKPFITDNDLTIQGMGLNLALTKLIIDAHNGNIKVINNEKGGAKVQLEFFDIVIYDNN